MWWAWKPSGPTSFHQERKFGCHCSSARCRRRSELRSTLLGMVSRAWATLGPPEVELRALGLAVHGERAALARRVGADEDPVLPGREPAEDLGGQRLRAGEAEVLLHAGERVGADGGPLFHGHAQLLLEVDVVGEDGGQAQLVRRGAVDRAFLGAGDNLLDPLRVPEEARPQPREAVPAGQGARRQRARPDLHAVSVEHVATVAGDEQLEERPAEA